MILIVTYELKSTLKDYSPFFDALKKNAGQWWHFMESTWIVSTNFPPDDFAKLLYPHMTNADSLFVGRLQKDYQGWLPADASD